MLFDNIQFGEGSSRTSITTLEMLKMFMENKLISYIDSCFYCWLFCSTK